MDHITLVGTVAASCTTIAFLPQVIKMHRTRHARDLSLSMYIIFSSGVVCWILYGVLTKSVPIIVANVVIFLLCLDVLVMKMRYK